jgi:Na+-transporting methylmalonyl-CoA/oxaloacetate decarboxylase gamma subunit
VKRLLRDAAVLLIGSGVVFLIMWLLVDAILGPIG